MSDFFCNSVTYMELYMGSFMGVLAYITSSFKFIIIYLNIVETLPVIYVI